MLFFCFTTTSLYIEFTCPHAQYKHGFFWYSVPHPAKEQRALGVVSTGFRFLSGEFLKGRFFFSIEDIHLYRFSCILVDIFAYYGSFAPKRHVDSLDIVFWNLVADPQ